MRTTSGEVKKLYELAKVAGPSRRNTISRPSWREVSVGDVV
jgi:hypothetical protein